MSSTAGIINYENLGNNLVGANLNLHPLAFNGGPTPTVALGSGSPAINAGSNPDGLAFDQQGRGLPANDSAGLTDIGAFQLQPSLPSATATSPNVGGFNPSAIYQFTVTYSDSVAVLVSTVAATAMRSWWCRPSASRS